MDVEELASRRAILDGVVEAESLPRLLEVVATRPDAVAYRIEFTRDASGRTRMSGHVKGVLTFVCQRCLGRLDWPLDAKFESVVVGNAQEDTGGVDAVTSFGGRIDPDLLIEEEILLALPNAPVHPRGSCDAPSFHGACERPPSRHSSPFSALRTLWPTDHPKQPD
ncbi:MAG: YceD family protein [Thiotrichales bacterium]|nr:YceD family protein [Thiotrichales bacterium]MCY4348655.1 YceD family protein [Thiotrichales bacterium]